MDNVQSVAKTASRFSTGTLISRFSGFIREMSMATAFGSHPTLAAFLVAYRFANLLRRLFGEGGLSPGFAPYFEAERAQEARRGALFFRDLFFSLLLIVGAVILIAALGLWLWGRSGGISPDQRQIIHFTMLMLPGALFLCLYSLSSSLLQCERKFFLPSAAPALFNAVWILAIWLLGGKEPVEAMEWLSVAIALGFMLQWALVVPSIWRLLSRTLSGRESLQPCLFSPALKGVLKPFFLGMISIGAVQINTALDALFARWADLEGPAYLWYAIRIQQLPLALFGVALSSALLPPLSRAMEQRDMPRYEELLRFGLMRSFSLIFPCTVALFVLAAAGVNFMYGRGAFSEGACLQTVFCLWGYGLGLLPSVGVLLLAPPFYARKDFRTPTLCALGSVAFSIALNSLFVFGLHWGATSIALATSLSAALNCALLLRALRRQLPFTLFNTALWRCWGKTAACSLIAGGMTLIIGYLLIGDPTLPLLMGSGVTEGFSREFSRQALHFFALAGLFAVALFSYAPVFGAVEVLELIGIKTQKASGV